MQANKRRHPKAKPRKRFWSFIRKLVLWCLVMAAIGAAVGYFGFMMAWKRYDNWAAEFDLERINDLEKPSIIYDRNGEEIGRIYVENRSYVTLDKISPAMINALIAQEDSRFREHPGYDFLGILRAGREYIHNSGDANQGASSITQQLARNAYDLKNRAKARNEGSFGRKFVEIALARRITERYSKDQVLEFYLNRVYFGSGFYGIRAASLGYFGKEPADLTTREAASIAALIKNPNGLSPLNNSASNLKWRNHVLNRMAKEKYITPDEAERLSAMELGLTPKFTTAFPQKSPHTWGRSASMPPGLKFTPPLTGSSRKLPEKPWNRLWKTLKNNPVTVIRRPQTTTAVPRTSRAIWKERCWWWTTNQAPSWPTTEAGITPSASMTPSGTEPAPPAPPSSLSCTLQPLTREKALSPAFWTMPSTTA